MFLVSTKLPFVNFVVDSLAIVFILYTSPSVSAGKLITLEKLSIVNFTCRLLAATKASVKVFVLKL